MALTSLAVITGASSGIGLELARLCAADGSDLVLGADDPALIDTGEALSEEFGIKVEAVATDLSEPAGVNLLLERVGDRPVTYLFANAGHGLGHAFLDQAFDDIMHVVNTNITGTIYLIQRVARDMAKRGEGRILVTGSVAGTMPGSYQAVYNGTKAFLDSFALALRNELKDSGVCVTCLMPGPTDSGFFARADMLDTKVARDKKDDPAHVAQAGYDAMMRGEASVVSGLKNKVEVAVGKLLPETAKAEQHRKLAEPSSGEH